jgi:hypothetical protein
LKEDYEDYLEDWSIKRVVPVASVAAASAPDYTFAWIPRLERWRRQPARARYDDRPVEERPRLHRSEPRRAEAEGVVGVRSRVSREHPTATGVERSYAGMPVSDDARATRINAAFTE